MHDLNAFIHHQQHKYTILLETPTTEGEGGGADEESGEKEPESQEKSEEGDQNSSEPQPPSRYHTEIGSSEDGG